MERQKPRTYTEEFKREALRLLETSDKSISQLERELGIRKGRLWKWKQQYKSGQSSNAEGHLELSDLEAAKAEIRRLQRELAETQEERDILKKTINIFSRPGR